VEASGARSVTLVDQPLSAAIGMGLPVHEARGHLIIDVGAGATDVSVLSLGGVVHSHTMRVGGDQMDQAIAHAVKSRLGIEISRAMAERLKFRFANDGLLGPREPVEEPTMLVRGRHIKSGYPASAAIPVSLVKDALAEPVRMLVDAVVRSLEFTPPDLAADIAQTGALMTGGGALHSALPRTVQDATGLPVIVPEDPICAVVLGASKYLEDPAGLFVRAS